MFHQWTHNCFGLLAIKGCTITYWGNATCYWLAFPDSRLCESTRIQPLSVLGHFPTGMLIPGGVLFFVLTGKAGKLLTSAATLSQKITLISFHALLFYYCEDIRRTLWIALQCCSPLPTCCNISIWKFTELCFSEKVIKGIKICVSAISALTSSFLLLLLLGQDTGLELEDWGEKSITHSAPKQRPVLFQNENSAILHLGKERCWTPHKLMSLCSDPVL